MSWTVLMFGSLLPELQARLECDYELHRVPDQGDDPEIDAALPHVRAVVTGGDTGLSGAWMERLPTLGLGLAGSKLNAGLTLDPRQGLVDVDLRPRRRAEQHTPQPLGDAFLRVV